MRTTLDLPDEMMRRAKIAAVERGSTLRQLVIDALQREMSASVRPRRRLERVSVKLSADAPLQTLSGWMRATDDLANISSRHLNLTQRQGRVSGFGGDADGIEDR